MASIFNSFCYFQMDVIKLKELLAAKIPIAEISRQLGVSRLTVYRHIRKENVDHRRHTDLSDLQLKEIISDIKVRHPESSEVMVTGHLTQQGIYIQRSRLRKILMDLDPEGIKRRRKRAIKRQVHVQCSMPSIYGT